MAVKRYDGSQWVTVAGKGDQGTSSSIATWVKTASGGETSVSGNDDNSQPLSYTVGQELVFINGALQKRGSDYTATTGNSITGLTALAANDVVTVWTVNAFSVTNAISNTLVDAKGDLVTASGADVPARLAAGTNGYVLTAASGEATGLKWQGFIGCRVHRTTNLSLLNATLTDVPFTSEAFDTNGFHSNTTDTARITIPTGLSGYYYLSANAQFNSSTTGSRLSYFLLNNTTVLSYSELPSTNLASIVGFNGVPYYLNAGDYVTLRVYQDSGGALDLLATNAYTTWFSIHYLGV
jgi:hypothetical protein